MFLHPEIGCLHSWSKQGRLERVRENKQSCYTVQSFSSVPAEWRIESSVVSSQWDLTDTQAHPSAACIQIIFTKKKTNLL